MITLAFENSYPRIAIMPRRIGHIAGPGASPHDVGLALAVHFYGKWVPVQWLGQPGWATPITDSSEKETFKFVERAQQLAAGEGFKCLEVKGLSESATDALPDIVRSINDRRIEVPAGTPADRRPKIAVMIGKPSGDQMSYPLAAFLQLERGWVPVHWLKTPWEPVNLTTLDLRELRNFISMIEILANYEGYRYIEVLPEDFPSLIHVKRFR